MHRTIEKVSLDTETLNYNTAISAMMEYVNALREAGSPTRGQVEPLVLMLAPYAPHFAEECWERMGCTGSVLDAKWPVFDAGAGVEDTAEIVVQVNGKVRARLMLPRGTSQEVAVAAAKAEAGAQRFIDGKEIRKVIYVQDRLVSIVV